MLLCNISSELLQSKLDTYNKLHSICNKITNIVISEDTNTRRDDINIAKKMLEVLLADNYNVTNYCSEILVTMRSDIIDITRVKFINPIIEFSTCANVVNCKSRWMSGKLGSGINHMLDDIDRILSLNKKQDDPENIIYKINLLCTKIIDDKIYDIEKEVANIIFTNVLQIREILLKEANSIEIIIV